MNTRRSFSVLKLAAVVGLLIGVSGCGAPNEYQAPPPPTVTVAQPVTQTVTNYLVETGTTEAVAVAEVRARVRGVLEEIKFEPGEEEVTEGDELFLIEQQEYKARVAAATAELESAKVERTRADLEYKRQQTLLKDEATSETNVVTAEADFRGAEAKVAAAEAALERANIDLNYTQVRAPISGRVGKNLVKIGNLVGDGEATHLTSVITYDPIYANFNISERALLELSGRSKQEKLKPKEEIPIFLQRAVDDGFPFEGHFDYADLAVDQSTGTFMIRGIFPNPDRLIVPGLFVKVRIPVGERENAILIPQASVSTDQAGKFVLVVNSQNEVERRDIRLGPQHGTFIVADDGLAADEWVIIEGLQRARPGVEVAPEKSELEPPSELLETVQEGASPPPKPAAKDPAAPDETTPAQPTEEAAPADKPKE